MNTTENSETVILTYNELMDAVEVWLRSNYILTDQEEVIFMDIPVTLNGDGDVEIDLESTFNSPPERISEFPTD